MTGLRILIVDDHAILREGLKTILAQGGRHSVAAEAANGPDAMTALRHQAIDFVLLDLSLPGRSGIELLKQIKQEFPRVPVLVLSGYPEDQYALRVVRQGAAGYLTKESAPELLLTAIGKVVSDGRYISPTLAQRLFDEVGGSQSDALHEKLSDREFEIFKLIAQGKGLTEIATLLHLSVKTVSTHRARILAKTGLHNNADLTRYALERRLLE
jgi:DNA-binding NarL/FixJ family response regulator